MIPQDGHSETGPAEEQALERVRRANAHLRCAWERIREALAGGVQFGAAELREIRQSVTGMAPLLRPATAEPAPPARRGLRPVAGSAEMEAELQAYERNLSALQGQFDRLRCMLLARCAAIRARQNHLQSVERWSAAWRQTL